MVTIASIAQRILDENKYTADDDMSLTNLEYCIDNVIDYVNGQTGASIAYLSGSAESKSLTCDRKYLPAIKLLSALMVRASQDRGPTVTAGQLGLTAVLADPQYKLFTEMINHTLNRCRGRSFKRT